MRSAEQVFYLAVFSLLGESYAASHATKSNTPAPNVCDISPGAIVSDACASYNTLEQLNEAIHPYLESITHDTDFFSHYRLSLYNKKCPFWDDEDGMCGNVACAVNTLDNEEDIPLVWRAKELGKLEGPTAQHPGRKQQKEERKRPLKGSLGDDVKESCVVEYDDECDERDYCVPDDESATAKGDYVSLVDNPERFTGYTGQTPKNAPSNGQSSSPGSPFGGFGNQQQMQAANQLKNVLQEQGKKQKVQSAIAHGSPVDSLGPVEFDDTCLEKRVFHRVISGMHASISTHLCWDYLNQTTGQWGPNLACYEQRLHNYPERISNVYFNYALVMRAVGKIKQHISDYSFCSEDPEQDLRTKNSVLRLASALPSGPEIFDETIMFQDPDTVALKEDFRNRFRNLVALINTMDRLSHSLIAIKEFRRMIDERDGVAEADVTALPEPDEGVLKTKLALEEAEEAQPINVLTGDDEVPSFTRDWDTSHMTVWDEIKAEYMLVQRTFMYVLYQWTQLPGRFTKIFILEMGRVYNWWMGFVPGPRSWEIRIPRLDEL
ncbi:hypothetical protein HRS9122_08535 [Pyrenophora teres f. teres]|nr:hypothetical protein HRS9122_08535 [Pyrenophora teres f. teres]